MSQTATLEKPKIKKLPPYNVILLNDEFHSFEYVVRMLRVIFHHQEEQGAILAKEIHKIGRAIVYTCSKELAEFRQEQVHAFGPDPIVRGCKGSMYCEIEPAV